MDCDPGKYCDGRNLTSPTDLCAPGYYCTIGKRFMFRNILVVDLVIFFTNAITIIQ